MDDRVEHAAEVAFDLVPRKQRHRIVVLPDVLGMARHDHLHEVLGRAEAALALDQHFVDLAAVEIADRPFYEVAFLVDLGRRDGFQRQLANLFPKPLEILVVSLDL